MEGRREFYFYASFIKGFETTLSALMTGFPNYPYECGNEEDPSWTKYFSILYPSPIENQQMLNRKVLDNLQKHGDRLTKPRLVDHWIYFRNEASRNLYITHVKSKGFVVVEENTGDGERPFSLQITRVDNVDSESIDSVVLDLFQLAVQMDAEYDGWETFVEKD